MPNAKVRFLPAHRPSGEEEYEASRSSSLSSAGSSESNEKEIIDVVDDAPASSTEECKMKEIKAESSDGIYHASTDEEGDGNADGEKDVGAIDNNVDGTGGIETAAVIVEEEEERDEDSNIADVTPTVGMSVEIRDPDFIWSAATIVDVQMENDDDSGIDSDDEHDESTSRIASVTVRYDGWGCKWDETLPWPSARLARLFTYTKRVKCLVHIMSKNRSCCTVWPSTVSFRMPHPNHVNTGHAEEFLRLEQNVFVAPYCQHLLPPHTRKSLAHGGRWMNFFRIRLWRNDLDGLGTLPKGFVDAHQAAMKDSTTPGTMPVKPFEAGSLLSAPYRVRKNGGEPVNGKMYTGECPPAKPPAPKKKKASTTARAMRGIENPSDKTSDSSNPGDSNKEEEEEEYQPPKYEPPPTCPPPIRITEPVYPTGGVVRFEKTKRWGASVSFGGNDVFLGSFPTQTQANNAIQEALMANKKGGEMPNGAVEENKDTFDVHEKGIKREENKARLTDLSVVSLESSIAALERQDMTPTNGSISLHNWTMQLIRHKGYIIEEREKRKDFEERKRKREAAANSTLQAETGVSAKEGNDDSTYTKCGEIVARKIEMLRQSSDLSESKSKRKKKSCPKRLDIQNQPPREYIL